MTDVVVPVEGKPEKPAKVKVAKEPKEPRFRKGMTQEQWNELYAKMSQPSIPEGYIGMSEICKQAVAAGIKLSRIGAAMGGDRGLNAPWEPFFQVVYVGSRKFGSPEILTTGFKLLKDPEYHKPAARGGRPKGEPKVKKPPVVKVSATNLNADWKNKVE